MTHARPTVEKADLCVAPDGSDANPGTPERPVATLARARDALRERIAAEPSADRLVLLRGGTHRLTETLVLDRRDGAAEGHHVTYAAYPGERPVLSAGVPVTGWRRLADEPEHLPRAARGRVWVADLPEGAAEPTALFCGEKRLPRARGAGFAIPEAPAGDAERAFHAMRVPRDAVGPWPDLPSAELVVIPQHVWAMNVLPIAGLDEGAGELTTAVPATYPLRPNGRAESAWIENTLAVLDEPGEWVVHENERRVYYWPEDGEPEAEIVAAGLSELIRIEGEIDESAAEDRPVEGIVLAGLELAHNRRYPWHGRTGCGLQHDWEAHDRPTAMVRLRGTETCAIRHCRFTAGDGAAIRVDLHGRRHQIAHNTIENMGGAGIVLAGYGPGNKDVNQGHQVTHNHVHRIGAVTWHAPAIFAWQSGHNRIAYNTLHHTPYTAVVVSGRIGLFDETGKAECSRTVRRAEVEALLGAEYPARNRHWHEPDVWYADWRKREPLLHSRANVVEHNDIHHVMQILGDGNGIYVSGAGADNLVRRNAVHDSPSPTLTEGIRCDDDQHETTIDGNLVYHLGGLAAGICIKGVNRITNNVVAAPRVERTERGLISLEVGPLHGTVVRRNVLYATTPGHRFYYQGPRLHGAGPEPLLRDCDADENLYYCVADPEVAEAHLAAERPHGIEAHSRCADPRFVDPGNGDYRFRADSPAHELGIVPVDPADTGC